MLLLEVSIPPLRGTPKLERDRENPSGETVKLYINFEKNCDEQYL